MENGSQDHLKTGKITSHDRKPQRHQLECATQSGLHKKERTLRWTDQDRPGQTSWASWGLGGGV